MGTALGREEPFAWALGGLVKLLPAAQEDGRAKMGHGGAGCERRVYHEREEEGGPAGSQQRAAKFVQRTLVSRRRRWPTVFGARRLACRFARLRRRGRLRRLHDPARGRSLLVFARSVQPLRQEWSKHDRQGQAALKPKRDHDIETAPKNTHLELQQKVLAHLAVQAAVGLVFLLRIQRGVSGGGQALSQ